MKKFRLKAQPALEAALTAIPESVKQLKNERVAVPTLWHQDHAGVNLTQPPGKGRKRLDEKCQELGLTWGIVSTYSRDNFKKTHVAVLVGVVVEGVAESLSDRGSHAWDEIDEALGKVAEGLA